jgi:hypothetical protein
MEKLKMSLHTMESPKAVKSRFSEYIMRLERKAKKRFDTYFEELLRACDIQVGAVSNP